MENHLFVSFQVVEEDLQILLIEKNIHMYMRQINHMHVVYRHAIKVIHTQVV